MKKLWLSLLAAMLPAWPAAAEVEYDVSGSLNALYGYSDVGAKYEDYNDNNHTPAYGEISFSASYAFDDENALSLHLDLSGATDKEVENYNQGAWGEEVYGIFDSAYGRVMLGQTYNVAYQFGVGAPSVGPLKVNNSDITDFIATPNWYNRDRNGIFKTLNSTDINTDGVAPKVSYISPEFYNSYLGFSFVPDSWNNVGLINRHADYKNNGGYVLGAYNQSSLGGFEIETSLGFARYENIDREYAVGLSIRRGNWTLGGAFRRSEADDSDYVLRLEDAFREGKAWNVGLGYEFGPYKAALTYFNSKADNARNEDQIIQLANSFQFNKYMEFYLIGAHVNFRGDTTEADQNAKGWAFVGGVGLSF